MLARKKALVVVLAGAGLCVACLAVYLYRDTLLELWYEWQLRSDDPEVRRSAAEALLRTETVRSLAILLEYVESPDPQFPNAPIGELDIRRFAKVVAARGPSVVPQLREALASKSAKVRRYAAKILLRLGPAAAEAAVDLGVALRDPDNDVRTSAAHTLRRLGRDTIGALDALSGAVSDLALDTDIRWCTAIALGEIGPAAESAIPALEEAAKAEDLELRTAATEALAKIRGE